jgi:antitoxin MazE
MRAVVEKWGHGLAIRIPKPIARAAGLHAGLPVSIAARNGKIVVEFRPGPWYSLSELLAGVNKKNLHRAVRTGASVGKEAW